MQLCIAVRSYYVHKFRLRIIKDCGNWSRNNIQLLILGVDKCAFDWCYDHLPSYNKMLYSWKPLKYKYWVEGKKVIKLLEL